MSVPIDIITCPQWGAAAPKQDITPCGKARRIIIHHTAGHHREISLPGDESREEAIRYARDIQAFHMAPKPQGRGWIDSGHNFLVCRNGDILQGRWGTVSQIENDRMVVSAHCPGQNDQIGIEHEHAGLEPMTKAQRESSARLIAWISWQYGRSTPLPLAPHSKYWATSCPVNLVSEIPGLYNRAKLILAGTGL